MGRAGGGPTGSVKDGFTALYLLGESGRKDMSKLSDKLTRSVRKHIIELKKRMLRYECFIIKGEKYNATKI